VSCSEEHWADDYEEHMHYCDILREANEDDHDLRSGRNFVKDFYLPIPDFEECLTNFTNWDTFFYTRSFDSINNDRSIRHLTKMLSYPITIASVVHELSPYNIQKGGRMTPEGLRSFTGKQISA
jgi:splicing suppressor protein 51